MLTPEDVVAGAHRVAADSGAIRDALNAADRRVGDGDCGMTIEQVVAAWQDVEAPGEQDIGATLIALGRATSQASGSSLASVIAIAFTAAGRRARGHPTLDRSMLASALAAAREAVVSRSGAALGDKTILDSIAAVEQALSAATDASDLYVTALRAAETALAEFRERESRIGRARMYGAKSSGCEDPGMLAAVLLLRAAR